MTVSVDIEVGRHANAIVIPSETVVDSNTDAPWVMAVEGHHLVKKPVKLGLKGEGHVEVREGVAPGDVVVATAGTALRPGQRVRAEPRNRQRLVNPFAFFEWIVAFRFMREGLTQTLLIVFGVALGAGVIIFMSALLAGMQANIVRRTLNFQAPISVQPPDQVARPLRFGATRRDRGTGPATLAAAAFRRPMAEGARADRADP